MASTNFFYTKMDAAIIFTTLNIIMYFHTTCFAQNHTIYHSTSSKMNEILKKKINKHFLPEFQYGYPNPRIINNLLSQYAHACHTH